jgi:hypothetical protein
MISAGALLSRRFFYFFEPFLGFGISNQASTIASSGDVSIFGSTFPLGTQNYSGANFSTWYQGGILLNFFILGIAAQYDNMFSLGTYSAKVSIRI